MLFFVFFVSRIVEGQPCGDPPQLPQQPEFYFYIKDNPGANYTIFAQKYGTSPIYDYNFQSTNIYDEQWERIDDYGNVVYFWASPTQYTQGRGFDWTKIDAGAGCRGILGYGLYKIEIRREWEPSYVFSFYLDVRQDSWTGSPDLVFKFDYNLGNVSLTVEKAGSNQPRSVSQYSLVELWTVLGIPKDWSEFIKSPEILNDFSGTVRYDVKTTLLEAEPGFPVETYFIGHQFTPGNTPNFWKEAFYKFSVPPLVTHNSIQFRARNWNSQPIFGDIANIIVTGNEIKTYYNPTYPLTISNYLDGGNSNNNFQLTWQNPDPDILIPWQFGTTYNAFRYQISEDVYQVTAPTIFQNLGTTWHFYKWNDGITNNIKSNLQITAPTTYTAYYKGIQRSDDENAYVSSSQRKFVRTDDGWLHNVYSSQGRVWYETSFNNGVTWQLANNGQPLDNGLGKLPSIDYALKNTGGPLIYKIAIVFQEKAGGSSSKIKLKYFEKIDDNPSLNFISQKEIATVTGDYSAVSTNPVIGFSHGSVATVIWKNGNTGPLYGWHGSFGNVISTLTGPAQISGTTVNSINPTIYAKKTGTTLSFKLAWEELGGVNSSSIKYATLIGYLMISGAITTPSNGSGFSQNYSPSIIQFMDASRLCWVGSRWISDPINEEDGFAQSKVLFKAPESTPSRFWQFGNFVSGPSINRKTGDDTYYAFAWYESSGQSKFADNSLSTIRTITDVTGQNLQISNGPNKENMFCMSFNHNVAVPYIFQMSDDLGSFYTMEKITYYAFNSGREGIVAVDNAEFYFAIGDISVDNQQINFREIEDSIQISTLNVLNDYLVSEPFEVSDNSSFTYSVQYGISDSVSAVNVLAGNHYVNFKVKLIDDNSGEILGEFDNVNYNSENVYQYNNISYQVNTQGLGNRTVRLKLIVDNNFNSDYSLSKIYSDESVLGKLNFKEININGKEVISTYDLFQNYPNPFNPSTTIKYQLPKDGVVTLKVYDILGAELATLVNEEKLAGKYEANFNASSLASGVYLYKLQANEFVSVKKMVLVR